jgi:hypothetical protein
MQNKASLPDKTYENTCMRQQSHFAKNPPADIASLMRNVMEQNRLKNAALQQQAKVQQPSANNVERPVQTVPPAAPMQAANPPLPPPHILQRLRPTPQEMQAMRMQHPAAPEEQLRNHIMNRKWAQLSQVMAARQRAEAQAVAAPGDSASTNAPTANAGEGGQVQRPALPTASPAQPNQTPTVVPKSNETAGAEMATRSGMHNATASSIPAAQTIAQNNLQRLMQITPQQIASMTPAQQNALMKKKEELIKQMNGGVVMPGANMTNGPGTAIHALAPNAAHLLTPPEQERLLVLFREVQAANPKGSAVNVDEKYVQTAREMLVRCAPPLAQMDSTYPVAMRTPDFPIELLRNQIRAKWIVSSNLDSNYNIKDYLGVTIDQLREVMSHIQKYMDQVRKVPPAKAAQDAQVQQAGLRPTQAQQQTTNPAQTIVPPTVNAAAHTGNSGANTIGKASQQSPSMPTAKKPASQQSNHARKTSSATKPPPAPTENRTFDWGTGAGLPKYDGRNELTPDKLKFPPSKKRKAGADSTASTPAAAVGTPAATAASPAQITPGAIAVVSAAAMKANSASPEQAMKPKAPSAAAPPSIVPLVVHRAEKKFRCSDPVCVSTHLGFDTENELAQHVKIQHDPVGPPLDFLLENAATLLVRNSAAANADIDTAKPEKLTLGEAMERNRSESQSRSAAAATLLPNDSKATARSATDATKNQKTVDTTTTKAPTMQDAMKAKLDLDSLPPAANAASSEATSSQILPFAGASHFADLDLGLTDTDGMGLFDWDMLTADVPMVFDTAMTTAAAGTGSTATPLSRTTSSASSTNDSEGVLFTPPSTSGHGSDVEITPHNKLTLHARLNGFVAAQTWSPYPGAVAGVPVAMEGMLMSAAAATDASNDVSAIAGGALLGTEDWLLDDNYFDQDGDDASDREGASRGQKKAKSDDGEAPKDADAQDKAAPSPAKPLALTANDFETILFDWDGADGIASAVGLQMDDGGAGDDSAYSGMEWEAWIKG